MRNIRSLNGDLNNWNMDITKMPFEDKYQVFDNSPLEIIHQNGIIYKQRRGMRYTHALFLLSWVHSYIMCCYLPLMTPFFNHIYSADI